MEVHMYAVRGEQHKGAYSDCCIQNSMFWHDILHPRRCKPYLRDAGVDLAQRVAEACEGHLAGLQDLPEVVHGEHSVLVVTQHKPVFAHSVTERLHKDAEIDGMIGLS